MSKKTNDVLEVLANLPEDVKLDDPTSITLYLANKQIEEDEAKAARKLSTRLKAKAAKLPRLAIVRPEAEPEMAE